MAKVEAFLLEEGRRLRDEGKDVVVALAETHGRAATAALLEGLEVVPRVTVVHRGVERTDMNAAAVLARNPDVALVDDLAHVNAPGSANARRWQDVDAILDAGTDVTSTVNIQHNVRIAEPVHLIALLLYVVMYSDGDPAASDNVSAIRVGERATLELHGRDLEASERRLLSVLTTQMEAALEHHDLAETAQEVGPLAQADRVRSALLAVVGHDLRRPLGAATAAFRGLRSSDLNLSKSDRVELLSTAAESLDARAALVTNLLDARRHAGWRTHHGHFLPSAEEAVKARPNELEEPT